jgi:cobaltochelatase CobN
LWHHNHINNRALLQKFFIENNPWALRDLSQRFLEIINREMWNDHTPEILENLKKIVNMADAKIEKNEY